MLLPFGRQYGTDFEESQVINWLSVVSAACEDFNSSTLQLEAQESLGDIVDTSAMSSSLSVSSHLVLCTHTAGRVDGKVHPHWSVLSLVGVSLENCIQLGFPASGQLVLLGPGSFKAT